MIFLSELFCQCIYTIIGPRQVAPECAPWNVKREIAFQVCQSPPVSTASTPPSEYEYQPTKQPTNQPTCRHKNLCTDTHTHTTHTGTQQKEQNNVSKGRGGAVNLQANDSREKVHHKQPKGIP